MRRGRWAIAAVVLVALFVPASVLRVRPGDIAVVSWRGGSTPDLRGPGFSLRLPILQRVRIYERGSIEVQSTLAAASREGSAVELPYEVKSRPGPQLLLQLDRDGGQGGAIAAVKVLVDEQLGKAAAATGTYDLASGTSNDALAVAVRRALEARLGPDLEVTLRMPILPADLRASFDQAALYGRRVETGVRVLLVGVDAGDWDVIDPLIAAGRMPHFARLKNRGAWGRLRSSVPTLSPLLWTTAATGKGPDRHGINDFLVADPRTGRAVPINATFRKTKAIWSILTEAGLSSDVIAWWATWPAERILGHLVSDRVAYSTFDLSGPKQGQGAVFPPEYAAVVESLRFPDEAVTPARIGRFVHITPEEFRRARASAARARHLPEAERSKALSESDESIDVLTRVVASTETYRRVALDLLDRGSREDKAPRLFAVYFQGVDEVNHRFAHCAPPRTPLCSGDDYRRFRDAVSEFYVYQDEILGEILQHARGATVMVMSDHGFASGSARPKDVKPFIQGKPGLWHILTGIFLADGPVIHRGEVPPVTLFDITPTILYLLGLPVPEDMPGKVIEGALQPDFLAAHPVLHVPSYEGLQGPGERPPTGVQAAYGSDGGEDGTNQEIEERLRALGYIGSSNTGTGRAGTVPAGSTGTSSASTPGGPTSGVPTLLYHTNLGAVYLSKRQYDRAEGEFKTALRIDPNSTQALSGMALLEEAKGNLDGALERLRSVVRLESGADHPTVIKIAELFLRMGKARDGLAYFREIEPTHNRGDQRELGLRVGYGMLYAAAGRRQEAEEALRRALGIEPASVSAMQELFAIYDGQGRSAALEPLIAEALRRNPRSAMHHNWLGLVLRRKGELQGAEREFKKTLEISPDLVGAMANLGSLYLQEGRPAEAVTVLQHALEKDPRNPESRINLIVALGMQHDLEGARRTLQDGEGQGQRLPLFYNALAYALHINGRNEEALETLREALRIDPRQPDALRLRSEIEGGQPGGGLPYR